MAMVLPLSRSPIVPREGLSGSGCAPGWVGDPYDKEKPAVSTTATSTHSTWNGRIGHRKPPCMIDSRRRTAATLHTQHALQTATFDAHPRRALKRHAFDFETRLLRGLKGDARRA